MYETAGYESSNYFKLLGPILLIVIFLIALTILRRLIVCAVSCCPENCFTRYIRRKTDYVLFIMRFLLEGCIEIGLSSMITVIMIDKDNFSSAWETVSTTFAFLSLLLLVLAPLYFIRVTR